MSEKLLSALAYAASSLLITFSNKILLTNYKFPSFSLLAVGQFVTTCLCLQLLKAMKIIDFPDHSWESIRKIFPLPIINAINVASGLGGTQALSLPMFTALRRFSIMFTMVFEICILKANPSRGVVFSVVMMVGGSMYAASNDLGFELWGYIYIFLNDLCTALNGVYLKKKSSAKGLNQFGLLYFNTLCSLPVMMLLAAQDRAKINNFIETDYSSTLGFWATLTCSVVTGAILNYSIYWCTTKNSALTTTVVGCMKNLVTAYAGIAGLGGDYVFQWANFIGLNISMVGSLVYAGAGYKEKMTKLAIKPESGVDYVVDKGGKQDAKV